jgi:hypothetical protein
MRWGTPAKGWRKKRYDDISGRERPLCRPINGIGYGFLDGSPAPAMLLKPAIKGPGMESIVRNELAGRDEHNALDPMLAHKITHHHSSPSVLWKQLEQRLPLESCD